MHVRPGFSSICTWALTGVVAAGLLAGCQSDKITTVAEKTPEQAAPSAELRTRAELEGVSPFADAPHTFDGYVWADQPTSASYTPDALFSFNRTGGANTITKTAGTGNYTVRFAGLSALLGSNSTVKVTGGGGSTNNDYCKPTVNKLLSDIVYIRCLNGITGAPVNTTYSVVVTRNYVELAFAHAHLKSSTDYPPQASGSWNPAGTMRVFRTSIGEYEVVFNGLGSRLPPSHGGHPQVVAIGADAAHCKVRTWGWDIDLVIYVGCMSRTGAPKDLKFNVLFLMPANRLGYAYANDQTAASYTPFTQTSHNSSGGAIGITRIATGRYTVTFSGLAPELLDGGNAQVTAFGSGNAQCKVEEWGTSGPDGFATVRCFAPGGALVDAYFTVFLGS